MGESVSASGAGSAHGLLRALSEPIRTTSCSVPVTAGWGRLRCSIQALVVIGMATQGYALPGSRWTVMA
ncbi:hypothetical protein [Geodermatophilus amargosae]|uniref:hypothetical protein n=1 Tax=Geodermatophilus amargosae TaxID=1296565 RepID=UPI00158704AE|nr:hypothetical protein [Geodermatophilus amargosae]